MPAAFSGERLPAAAAAGQPLLPACLSLLLPSLPSSPFAKKLRQKTAKKKNRPRDGWGGGPAGKPGGAGEAGPGAAEGEQGQAAPEAQGERGGAAGGPGGGAGEAGPGAAEGEQGQAAPEAQESGGNHVGERDECHDEFLAYTSSGGVLDIRFGAAGDRSPAEECVETQGGGPAVERPGGTGEAGPGAAEGEVISLGDARSYFIMSTAKAHLGVLYAKSVDGEVMVPVNWELMEDPNTKAREPRKVAKVLQSPIVSRRTVRGRGPRGRGGGLRS